MKLYGFPPSPNTWQVRALAAYLGVPLEFEFVDLPQGAQRAPAFLALNPTGRTPVLVDGDFKLWETMAIMQYIASKKPNALWPNDARGRADITRWQSWNQAHWNRDACVPLLFERFVKKMLNLGEPDHDAIAKGVDAFAKEAGMLDAHLGKQKYLVGDALTVADFAVAAPLLYSKQADLSLQS
ncbi:MAG TPA: glutathione S-transferase family protein, partial [Xanthobacteraceae bacterium]